MFDLAVTLVFAVHLLAVNVATAAPLVCVWLAWRSGRRGDAVADGLGVYLAWLSISSLAAGIVAGAALVGVLWVGGQRQFIDTLIDQPWVVRWKLWWGLVELVFYFGCMGAYLATWRPRRGWRGLWHPLLAVLAATNLLYHFPTLFSILTAVSMNPTLVGGATIDRPVFGRLMASGEVLSMVVHFALAALATTGVAMMGYALRMARRGADGADAARAARWGGWIALVPTLGQLLVGAWVLFNLPEVARGRLMGGDWLGTALLAASVLAALGLMHQLAAVALGEVSRPAIVRSMGLLVLVVVLMSGTLQRTKADLFGIASRPAEMADPAYAARR